jgi:hypothetical protein
MQTIYLVLYILAAGLFVAAFFAPPSTTRWNLLAAGLFAQVMVPLLVTVNRLN